MNCNEQKLRIGFRIQKSRETRDQALNRIRQALRTEVTTLNESGLKPLQMAAKMMDLIVDLRYELEQTKASLKSLQEQFGKEIKKMSRF